MYLKKDGSLQTGGVSCNPEYICQELNMFLSIAMFFQSLRSLCVCVCMCVCPAGISHGFTKCIFSEEILSASYSFDTTLTYFSV